ncbi:MAG: beta-N-acetylhexosaminidase [Paenibacillaceae bacterium]
MDIKGWSLRKKIGQMFMFGFDGYDVPLHMQTMIRDYQIGGIIYFRRNLRDAQQVSDMSRELQRLSEVPLLIAVDQEGGMVVRMEQDVTVMPGNMALGATGDVQGTYDAARICGEELRRIGINMNFAPCLDVNNNPLNPVIGVRSYGEDPKLVGRLGVAAVRGYQQANVAATVKHFPGHGDTDQDSHYALPLVAHDRARLDAVELAPFRDAIAAGVDAVMSAHVIFPAYEDANIPSTLSHNILQGLLREQLLFDGVIVTDCLEMNAISESFGVGSGAVMTVKAGADLVLISHRVDRQIEGIEAVIRAVEAGEISEARIDASVGRIVRLKELRKICGILSSEYNEEQPASEQLARRLSEKSVTLVKREGNFPLKTNLKTLVVWPLVRVSTEVVEIIEQEVTLGLALGEYIDGIQEISVGIDPTEDEVSQVLAAAGTVDQVVVATYNAGFSPDQVRMVKQLASLMGKQLIVAAVRNPFDLTDFPEVSTYLCSYENKPLAMHSLAKVLVGILTPQGKLPVTVGEFASSARAEGTFEAVRDV